MVNLDGGGGGGIEESSVVKLAKIGSNDFFPALLVAADVFVVFEEFHYCKLKKKNPLMPHL